MKYVVLPSVLLSFIKSEVWGIFVNSNQVVLPVFASSELLSTAFHQTLVLKGVKEAPSKTLNTHRRRMLHMLHRLQYR